MTADNMATQRARVWATMFWSGRSGRRTRKAVYMNGSMKTVATYPTTWGSLIEVLNISSGHSEVITSWFKPMNFIYSSLKLPRVFCWDGYGPNWYFCQTECLKIILPYFNLKSDYCSRCIGIPLSYGFNYTWYIWPRSSEMRESFVAGTTDRYQC